MATFSNNDSENRVRALLNYWGRPWSVLNIKAPKASNISVWLSGEKIMIVLISTATQFAEITKALTGAISKTDIDTMVAILDFNTPSQSTINNLRKSLSTIKTVPIYLFSSNTVLTGFDPTTVEKIRVIQPIDGRRESRLLVNPNNSSLVDSYPRALPTMWPALLWQEKYFDNTLLSYRVPMISGGSQMNLAYVSSWSINSSNVLEEEKSEIEDEDVVLSDEELTDS